MTVSRAPRLPKSAGPEASVHPPCLSTMHPAASRAAVDPFAGHPQPGVSRVPWPVMAILLRDMDLDSLSCSVALETKFGSSSSTCPSPLLAYGCLADNAKADRPPASALAPSGGDASISGQQVCVVKDLLLFPPPPLMLPADLIVVTWQQGRLILSK